MYRILLVLCLFLSSWGTRVSGQCVQGTVHIGGSTPDFATFSDFAAALNDFGVCGPVIAEVWPGTYTEHFSLDTVQGVSPSNYIIIRSITGDSSDVVITYLANSTAENYVVRLDNTPYVTLQHLTLRSTGLTWALGVSLRGNFNLVSIQHCEIEGTSGSTSINKAGIYSDNGYATHFDVSHNYIKNVSYGIYLTNQSGGGSYYLDNNVIHPFYMGCRMEGAVIHAITNNIIQSNHYGNYNFAYGIYLTGIQASSTIASNDIELGTGLYGIYMFNAAGTLVQPVVLVNNMISIGAGTTTRGIWLDGTTTYTRLLFNTIHVLGGTATNAALYNSSSGNNLELINNIFANTGTGYAVYNVSGTSIAVSDYNDLYSGGSYLGFQGNNYGSLPAWQNGTGKDAHSISVEPGFLSQWNVHVTSALLDQAGSPIPGINTDFDGDIRHPTSPDIGADEFIPPPNDLVMLDIIRPAALGCDGNDSTEVEVLIYNNGSAPQSNFSVKYLRYSTVIATETVATTLLPGDSLYYTFNTTVDLSSPSYYPITAIVTGTGDTLNHNDTIRNKLIASLGIVESYPDEERFDNPAIPPGWINEFGDDGEDWQFGYTSSMGINAPTYDNTTGTRKGYFTWINDNAPHSSPINLHLQCFDFDTLVHPHLSFYYWNAGNSVDLFVDILDSTQWKTVAGPLGNQGGPGWKLQLIDLSSFSGRVVKIRFRAQETGAGSGNDMAIDDINVFDLGAKDVGITALNSPFSDCGLDVNEPITVTITNIGYNTLLPGTTIPVGYRINNGPVHNDAVFLVSALPQMGSVQHVFNMPYDFSANGDYEIIIWSSFSGDNGHLNDTLVREISNYEVHSFPYPEDFESFTIAADATGFFDNWYTLPAATTNQFRWNVHSGATPNTGTGPAGDHTSGSGKYLYTEASNGILNDTARVISTCVDISALQSPGLNFSYHMWGNTVGSLQVDLLLDNGQVIPALWSRSGNQGNRWLKAAVDLSGFSAHALKIRFTGTRGSGASGDMAIDDIRIGEMPSVSFPDTIYDCGQVILDGGNLGDVYYWSTGETSKKIRLTSVPTGPIVYDVVLIVTNDDGLYGIDSTVVVLQPGPIINLGGDTLACGLTSLVLDAGNAGSTYLWDNAATQQTRMVTADGTYYVSVTRLGCTKSDTITVDFEPATSAAFTYSGQSGQYATFSFSNISQHATTFLWDFGDGFLSAAPNPIHVYGQAGQFTVTLIATGKCGSDTSTQVITAVGMEDAQIDFPVFYTWPQPVNTLLNVFLNIPAQAGSYLIVDVRGVVLRQGDFQINTNGIATWDVADLPAGMYFIDLSIGQYGVTRKFIHN